EERIAYEKYLEVMAVDVRFITKQKEKLEQRVRERTEALNKANEELNAMLGAIMEKNRIIEEKNHDIIESITYAHRIQTAILPNTEYIRLFVPHFSVFYRPKDIVSGDFYWFAFDDVTDRAILAAVDCTGHGVPGAFMSVIGYNLLNRIVIEQGIVEPDAILAELDRQVIFSLKQHEAVGEQPNDGMDVALVSIDRGAKTVHFAGANRPFYYLDGHELVVVNGDKYPIGGTQIAKKRFVAHSIVMKGTEKCYLFTDGYADQFGGPNMKKFSPRRIREWIVAHAAIPVVEQAKLLEKTFDAWKGENEQLDDITIMVFSLEDMPVGEE
ncbi:MAG: SpoIIE family protein phosphatase, partial [Bacteroidia bacterium]|nr:SpoIIE family protein phosphatase [Bacteroidia bacterium]MDW8334225.1 SpoIIE family protein phosphatase [Bacteroidia bacterium]